MQSTVQRGGVVVARGVLVVVSIAALLAMAFVLVIALVHYSQAWMSPEISATVHTAADPAAQNLPLDARSLAAVVSTSGTEVWLSARDLGIPFLAWSTAAWACRYGLGLAILGSVVYLGWRLGRGRGIGSAAPWWAGSLGVASMTVALFAPWALVHADRLVFEALDLPTDGTQSGAWFTEPSWSLQDTDPWLLLFGALLALLGLLLRGARRAEIASEGLI